MSWCMSACKHACVPATLITLYARANDIKKGAWSGNTYNHSKEKGEQVITSLRMSLTVLGIIVLN